MSIGKQKHLQITLLQFQALDFQSCNLSKQNMNVNICRDKGRWHTVYLPFRKLKHRLILLYVVFGMKGDDAKAPEGRAPEFLSSGIIQAPGPETASGFFKICLCAKPHSPSLASLLIC